jgi:hypothetical protein
MKKTMLKLTFALALAAGVSTVPASSEAAAPCPFQNLICADVYDPVICLNGKVYSNQCYATRACAVGCVPYDPAS